MSLHWKMHTNFPFTRVLVLGIFLFFLGLASMIISIIAFVTQSWGHYVGTGMWGGATILATGLTAIFTSRLRSLASVKTFCLSSFVAVLVSLIMLILSAGGLTLTSGFYGRIDPTEYNKRTSNLIHASLLVMSVFCLSGNVLALIVCCKYIFFEHHEKPKHRRRHRILTDGSARSTTPLRGGAPNTTSLRPANSRTPLHNEASSRRHSDNSDVNRVQIEYRRSHRRTASDQLHSHARRQRHSHQIDGSGCNNNSNLLSAPASRYYPDRRNTNVRSSSQVQEIKDLERLNIQPLRQSAVPPVRHCAEETVQVRLSRSPVTHEIRLPTEFNEEELPPYEEVVSQAAAEENGETASDSGDESDTENSSSSEAESYNVDYGEDGGESFPMVSLQQPINRNGAECNTGEVNHCSAASNSQRLSCNTSSQLLEQPTSNLQAMCRINQPSWNELHPAGASGTMIVRKDSSRSNRPVLSYVANSSDQLGDYERLLSVSPEVCAITGEIPDTILEQHSMNENFYENGPCYENIKCVGKGENEGMNFLSKVSSSEINSALTCGIACATRNVSVTEKNVSTATVPGSPPSQGNFGSSLSAFRPVHTQPCITNDLCSPAEVSSHSQAASSPLSKIHTNTRAAESADVTSRYKEQGAIPKNIKSQDNEEPNDKGALSWKNILLPLSYNHSDCASNETEKKLPSKTIPFTDSDNDNAKPSALGLSAAPSKLSLRVYPLASQNLLSSIRSPDTASSSAVASSNTSTLKVNGLANPLGASGITRSKSNSSNVANLAGDQPSISPPPATVTSLVKEASTQASASPTSRWHSHRMGGTQALLQSRREEMQNSQLSRRVLEVPRSNRPSSMPAMAGGNISNGISALVSSPIRQLRGDGISPSSSPADSSHPLSLRSYLVSSSSQPMQHSQSLALRQNHFLQHYPLQPQQPRLGVQLHQRRQQQHQLQQNIESQQQQQLQQQQQQQQVNNQQPPQQQARGSRPLFSVLL